MKFSKDFYLLLGHINPAIYDFIFPHGPVQNFSGYAARESKARYYQAQGSAYGTDFSGDLKVLAKLSWKMSNLAADLRTVTVQAKSFQEQRNGVSGRSSFISELIDEYCGTVPRFHFPPRPNWFDEKVTIEEKVAAAALFAQAAAFVEGTEIESVLFEGADKILNSAMEQVAAHKMPRVAYNDFATHAEINQ